MSTKIIFKCLVRVTTLCLLFVSLSGTANASSDELRGSCSVSFIYENDRLEFTDKNYTFGALLAKTCISENERVIRADEPMLPLLRNSNKSLSLWTRNLFGIRDNQYVENSDYLGFSLFTPNLITSEVPDGRPYAALAIYGDSVVFTDAPGISAAKAFKQELQLGIIGMTWGGRLQRAIHRAVGAPEPVGWSSQISHGGEPTFLYSFQRKTRLCGGNISCAISNFDLSANLGGTMGYYNSLRGNISIRFGGINSPFWGDYGPIHNRITQPMRKKKWHIDTSSVQQKNDTSIPRETIEKTDKSLILKEAYLFVSGGADFVFYNVLLQGQFRNSDYVIASSDLERIIPRIAAGIVIDFDKLQFTYSYSHKEPEIRGGRSHRWHTFSLGFNF